MSTPEDPLGIVGKWFYYINCKEELVEVLSYIGKDYGSHRYEIAIYHTNGLVDIVDYYMPWEYLVPIEM